MLPTNLLPVTNTLAHQLSTSHACAYHTYLEAKHPRSRLIKPLDQGNVKVTPATPERQIHKRICPWMTSVEHHTPTRKRPRSAIRRIGRGVDVCARILPLASGRGEGVAAPCRRKEAEVCGHAAGQGCQGEEGGKLHFGMEV
jgi:hypothetical protein